MKFPKLKRPGSLFLIGLCFFGSGAIRFWDNNAAIAEEVAGLTSVSANAADTRPLSCPPPLEPASLLKAIQDRQQQLDKKEERLANREQVLRVARIRVDDEIKKLEEVEKTLSATIARAEGAAEKDIDRITAVYENMKAPQAAAIFETMDVTFAAGFLMKMRPDAAAGILANLTPESAYSISVVMAGRNADVPRE